MKQQIRFDILQRDNHTCQLCGIKNVCFDIHHVIPRMKNGMDIINNLTTLCRRCHKIIEPINSKPYIGKMTTIPLTKERRRELKNIGREGESYDQIIKRLLRGEEED